jgi:uncharacterized membrane protein YjjP (DUF1212 family)
MGNTEVVTSDAGPRDFHYEDDLEPRHLIKRSDTVLRAGILMLGAGTGSRRVKETMRQVAEALDLDTLQAQITFNDITLTVSRRGIFRTQVAEVESVGAVNCDRIASLQRLAGELDPHSTVGEVDQRLDAAEARGRLYPAWAIGLAAALGCATFALLNNAAPIETIAVLFAAFAGQSARVWLSGLRINLIATIALAAFATGLVYVGITQALGLMGIASPDEGIGYMATFIFLVPGFPLLTAALDIARLDLEAGVTRLVFAGLVMLAVGMVAWALLLPSGVPTGWVPSAIDDPVALTVVRALATFLGVAAFAVMFNAPLGVAVAAGAIAMPANLLRFALVGLYVPGHVAVAIATLLIGLLVWFIGGLFRLPRIILSVPAVIVLVPGLQAYRALVAFNEGQLLAALDQGIAAVLIVIGVAAGLAAARMLTDPQWAFTKPDPPQLFRLPHVFVREQRAGGSAPDGPDGR